MTTATMPRPPAPSRQPAPGVGQATVTIDPIKLLKKHKWVWAGAAVLGVGLGIGAHFLLLKIFPIYSAQVLWECYTQEEEIGKLVSSGASREELDKFMATQAQLLASERVFDMTVTDPALERTAPNWRASFVDSKGNFNAGEAVRRLKWRVSAGIVGDSNLIRLSMWDTNKKEAAAIVRLVGDVYERSRQAAVTREAGKRRDLLKKAIDDTDRDIEAAQRQRNTLIGDSELDTLDAQSSKAQQTLRLLSEQWTQGRSAIEMYSNRLQQMQAQLESPTGPTYSDDLREEANNDPTILNLKYTINQLDGELKGLTGRGIGRGHTTFKTVESRLEGLRQSLDAEFEKTLRRVFDSRLEQLRMAIGSTTAQMQDVQAKLEEEARRASDLAKVREKVEDIKGEVARLNEVKSKFKSELASLLALSGLDTANRIRVVQDAQEPREVAFPKLFIMVPAGLILILGLAVGVVVFVEIVDQRVKGPSDIDMISRVRCLGLIPHAAEDPANPQRVETVFRDAPKGVLAESYRQARGAVLKRMNTAGRKSVVVLAGLPGSGATSAAVNLAFAAAASDLRVLLVDANFRRPALHRVLGLKDHPGLADILSGSSSLDSAVQQAGEPVIHVLTAGTSESRAYEKLGAEAMGRLIEQAEREYDLVVLDAPPAVVAEDGLALANRAGASLLVVRALGEKRGMVARLRNELAECRGEFLGVLINAARSSAGGYLRGNILATHRYSNGQE
jgi:succinoglycan biosynthesis transport protein ExoP